MIQTIYDHLPGREKERWFRLTSDSQIKDLYEISTYGRLRNRHGKILRPWADKDGYLKFTLQSVNGEKIKRFSHRLVGLQFIPNPENKPEINHKRVVFDGERNICPHNDNYYENLEWVTREENTTHSLINKLENEQPTCENAYRSKFSNDIVHSICAMLERGFTTSQILTELGFEPGYSKERESFRGLIKHVRSRKHWTNISDLYYF